MKSGDLIKGLFISAGLMFFAGEAKPVFAEGEFYGSKVIFIIDKSGSMSAVSPGQSESRLALVEKETVKQVNEYQRKEAEVTILAFDTDVYECAADIPGGMLNVIRKGIGGGKERLAPGGATDIVLALSEAMRRLDNVANPIVYLYTDGEDTVSRPGHAFEDLIKDYEKYVQDNKRPWSLYFVTLGFLVDPNTRQWLEEGLDAETVSATPEQVSQWAAVEYEDVEFVCRQTKESGKSAETTESTVRVHTVPTNLEKRVTIEAEFLEDVPSGVSVKPAPDWFKFGDEDLRFRLKIDHAEKLPVKEYALRLRLSSPDDSRIKFWPSPDIPAQLRFSRIYTLLLKKDGMPQKRLFLGRVEPGKKCGLSVVSAILPPPSQAEILSPELQSKIVLQRPRGLNKYGLISFDGLEGETVKTLAGAGDVHVFFRLNEIIRKTIFFNRRIIMSFPLRVEGSVGLEPSELVCEITVPSYLSKYQTTMVPLLFVIIVAGGVLFYYLNTRKPAIDNTGEFFPARDSVARKLPGRSGYIGSNPRSFIKLEESETVAPEHARVFRKQKALFLEHAAGDAYKTVVNGEVLQDVVSLEDGTKIRIGDNTIEYKKPEQDEEVSPDTEDEGIITDDEEFIS